ncbi:glycosyltransferase [Longilinea arvoryzae]|uniref:Glycosyltransferase n=1 Tax=Longilinea arvoryzae TaxID=360412 RepID=A0A0S7BHA6_9CHLR|nr:glycosyltransferase [Longilinea arvoryzae]GAP13955.1 glycosyltransferase [Longilinea arvoryzae]
MKILYLVHQFYPEFQSGTEKIVYNSAFMTQKNGNEVKVITYGFYPKDFFTHSENGILWKEFIYQGIPVLVFQYEEQPFDLHISLADPQSYEFAKRIILRESPDVVHVGHPMRVHQFIRAAKEQHIPILITLTDFFLICPKVILAPTKDSLCSGPEKGLACKRFCGEIDAKYIRERLIEGRNILESADVLVSPSKFLAETFLKEIDDLQIQINNHGIRYGNIASNQKIYSQTTSILFGFTGYIQYHKGVHILIKAFRGIKNSDTRLYIYGPGEETFLRQLKEIANNDDRIIFKGPFLPEQLAEIFQEIDVLVTPSIWYENYPMVLHEALASNVPVIASDLGGMSEKIKNGFNGLTFIPGDVEDLQNKLSLVINHRELINQYKENIKNNMVIPNVEQEAYWYQRVYRALGDREDLTDEKMGR